MNNIAENIVNQIMKIEEEEIVIIRGKAFVIRPAEVNDLERVIK